MATEAKRETVAELRDEVSRTRTFIVSEYRGLKVSELAQIRKSLRKQDVSYRVVKNRLMRLAADGPTGQALSPLLEGPTAIAFGTDEAATARAVLEATRPFRIVKIKGAVLGSTAITAEEVVALAALPSREVLQARLAGAIVSPIATLAGLLSANLRNLAYGLQQLADKRSVASG
jgi:large subunit ribosomal protein L10